MCGRRSLNEAPHRLSDSGRREALSSSCPVIVDFAETGRQEGLWSVYTHTGSARIGRWQRDFGARRPCVTAIGTERSADRDIPIRQTQASEITIR